MNKQNAMICSFCRKNEYNVQSMFSAGLHHIRCECVMYCYEQLFGSPAEKLQKKDGPKFSKELKLIKPVEIKKILDEYVIGQDDAQKRAGETVFQTIPLRPHPIGDPDRSTSRDRQKSHRAKNRRSRTAFHPGWSPDANHV